MARFEPIAEVYRGVRFRQFAPKLRWTVGDGFADERVSERPRNERTGQFTDSEGTYVVFEDDARVNVDFLLKTGGLQIEDTNQRRGARAEKAAAEVQAMTSGPLSERPLVADTTVTSSTPPSGGE